jgi:hypothetical protein
MQESPWKIRAFLAFQKGKVRLICEVRARRGQFFPVSCGEHGGVKRKKKGVLRVLFAAWHSIFIGADG